MTLVKWNPESSLLPSFSSWIDDFFADNGDFPMPKVKGVSIPAVNVTENKKEFRLEVAAPGFNKEDFKLEVKNGYLTISGESKFNEEKEDEKFMRREFRFNSFSRSFTLPDNVKEDKIEAIYKDGILQVVLPKMKEEKEELIKSIPIK
ncbi:MAG: Hsp20/alpha crystallin family protein [Bacteroidetes bacterium]|nr:MAG: Hsp20/alpha crystallin family protein [Bacteroidota bacterium]